MPKAPGRNAGAATEPAPTPFRFYDNRQKYLAFVTACNEKSAIARRAADELALLQPTPPAVRLFDAGMGDGTVIARLMRSAHRQFPTVPMCVVAKEISLEPEPHVLEDRKSTRLNSSHVAISYAVFCLKKKKTS